MKNILAKEPASSGWILGQTTFQSYEEGKNDLLIKYQWELVTYAPEEKRKVLYHTKTLQGTN
jgi:hypothetical protein